MPEWMTTDNVTLALVVLMVLERIVRAIAPKTETKIDDRIIASLDDARDWAEDMAPHLWAIVETMAAQGAIPKARKAALFGMQMKEAYHKATGKMLPEGAIATAETVAAGISAADKLGRLTGTPTASGNPDPQPGPASS